MLISVLCGIRVLLWKIPNPYLQIVKILSNQLISWQPFHSTISASGSQFLGWVDPEGTKFHWPRWWCVRCLISSLWQISLGYFYRPLCFYTCLSVILFTGGDCLGPDPRGEVGGSGQGGCLGPGPRGRLGGSGQGGIRPTPGGCPGSHLGGSGSVQAHTQKDGAQVQGVSRPRPGGVQAQAWGCIPACTEADTPNRRLLLRAVRIPLECILVWLCNILHNESHWYRPNCVLGYLELFKVWQFCQQAEKQIPIEIRKNYPGFQQLKKSRKPIWRNFQTTENKTPFLFQTKKLPRIIVELCFN